jgi:hypothetical protein
VLGLVFGTWAAVLVSVFVYLSKHDHTNIENSKWFQLQTFTGPDSYFLRKKAATLQPQQLPHTADHNQDEKDHLDGRSRIYLFWPSSEEAFTAHNYASLESILAAYPHAVIRVLVPASFRHTKYPRKGILAFNRFQKYRKQGFDIQMQTLSSEPQKHRVHTSSDHRTSYYHTFVQPLYKSCTTSNNCTQEVVAVPYHLQVYLGLQEVWRTGGILTDFSFLFLDTLHDSNTAIPQANLRFGQDNDQSFYMNSYCVSPSPGKEENKVYRPRSFDSWSTALHCSSSLLLQVRSKESSLVACILSAYHSDEVFFLCLQSDDHFAGAVCLQRRLQTCLETSSPTASLLGAKQNVLDSNTEDRWMESFGDDPAQARRSLLSHNWTLLESVRVLWMGQLAWQRRSRYFPYPIPSLLHSAYDVVQSELRNRSHAFSKETQRSARCSPYAHQLYLPHNLMDLFIRPNELYIQTRKLENISKDLYYTNSSIISTATKNSSTTSTSSLLYEVASLPVDSLGELTCAPAAVIAGFSQSQSSAAFQLLQLLPMVLAPSCGYQYEQSGTYRANNPTTLTNRAMCFANVIGEENLISIDGDNEQHRDPYAPFLLKQV